MTYSVLSDALIDGSSDLVSFITSLAVIICSEIGDRTFFIAALLSMRQPWTVVFLGATTALWLMTVLSALVGVTLTHYMVLSESWAKLGASISLLIFGVKMLMDGRSIVHGEELREVEEGLSLNSPSNPRNKDDHDTVFRQIVGSTFFQAFVLTFLAEWGDKSQLATVALTVSRQPSWVVLGALSGHGICCLIACLGGRMLATSISEKVVSFVAGILYCAAGTYGLLLSY